MAKRLGTFYWSEDLSNKVDIDGLNRALKKRKIKVVKVYRPRFFGNKDYDDDEAMVFDVMDYRQL